MMQNPTLIAAGRDILKRLLAECTVGQQMMFKRMYSRSSFSVDTVDINDVVDYMDVDRIDHAITQCERSIEKNRANQIQSQGEAK